jgi:hypothetical protein
LPSTIKAHIDAFIRYYSFAIYAAGEICVPSLSSNDPLVADNNMKLLPLSKGGDNLFDWVDSNDFSL